MKLHEQRTVLIDNIKEAEEAIGYLMEFLQNSDKFKGQGEDWIRTGEVWPILRDIRNGLQWKREER